MGGTSTMTAKNPTPDRPRLRKKAILPGCDERIDWCFSAAAHRKLESKDNTPAMPQKYAFQRHSHLGPSSERRSRCATAPDQLT